MLGPERQTTDYPARRRLVNARRRAVVAITGQSGTVSWGVVTIALCYPDAGHQPFEPPPRGGPNNSSSAEPPCAAGEVGAVPWSASCRVAASSNG